MQEDKTTKRKIKIVIFFFINIEFTTTQNDFLETKIHINQFFTIPSIFLKSINNFLI